MQFFTTLFLVHFVFSHEHSDNEKQDIITTDQQAKAASQLKQLSGRSIFSRRKNLPRGNLLSGGSAESLSCGETYSVAKDGYYMFTLNPRSRSCAYNFLGSKTEGCTVAILCEKITLAPPSSAGCEQEWLVLSDGTEGLMSGCGTFSFSDTPRIPRNNGSDLYFHLKGSSASRCIAFCNEELTAAQTGVQKAKKISKNKKYQGYQMESQCKCGIRKNIGRIVGGENAFKFEFPWIGAIVFKGTHNKRKPFCGGSLVSDRYFISAAHCFAIEKLNPNEIQVVLHAHVMDRRFRGNPDEAKYQKIPGWNLPEETDESEKSIRMDVQEIINHPLFDDRTFDYDIAILKFTRAVNLKKGKVAPICLPYVHEFFPFEDGTDMVVAGWGRPWEDAPAGSRLLQKLDVPYLNLEDCDRYTVPTRRHLCAGYIEGGKDACAGDSGGPLMYQFNPDESQYFLSGIVSAGAGCARRNNLGLYSNVQELLQWTYHHMPDAIYCPRS